MTGAQSAISLAAAYDRGAVHLAGPSESTPLRAVAAEYGIPLVLVEGTRTRPRSRLPAATVWPGTAKPRRLPVVAFWPDVAILNRPGKHVAPQSLLDTMLRIRAGTLMKIAVPLQAAAARWPGSR